ncbi:MAG: YkgJ family cysteine cluster protein [Gammaproteobacteria bacterium]|nr:YkgJ family cysteine cluster protein [Gammaproteobacteria bacterium]MDH5803059.1 YkgJ family cysteine cluster protein [Gammaproteobacteria bacterium]
MPKNKNIPVKIAITPEKITPENKCSFCSESKCCNYITQQIDTPRSMRDFDHLLWQTAHLNVQIYKDDDGWFLLVNTPCRHLQSDGGCGVYLTRPIVCREHDNDYCEYDAPAEDGFELFFDGYDALETYCRKRFKSWDKRYDKEPEPA